MKHILIIALLSLLTACTSAFQKPDASANYGNPPLAYEETIKAYFSNVLKDPESAKYKFGNPVRAYANNGLAYGGKVAWVGYMVEVQINAKNSYGGYVGYKPHMVLFTGNAIAQHVEGSERGWISKAD